MKADKITYIYSNSLLLRHDFPSEGPKIARALLTKKLAFQLGINNFPPLFIPEIQYKRVPAFVVPASNLLKLPPKQRFLFFFYILL